MNDRVKGSEDNRYDVICVGTALIDHLSFADLTTITALGLSPGAMTLIDDETAVAARARLREDRLVSGGTVANTAAGVASFGASAAFVGAVANDEFGVRYARDLAAANVHPLLVDVSEGRPGASTGACYVMVSSDEERTMATHLGVSGELRQEHLGPDLCSQCAICYFDGYLLDFPEAEAIVNELVRSAKEHGTLLAFGLADRLVVERHRERLQALVPDVGLLFANQDEIRAFAGTEDLEQAARRYRHEGMTIVVTRSEEGALIVTDDGVTKIEALAVPRVMDVTGAGDLYAAGVLYAIVAKLPTAIGGSLGALAASEVITHLGARPERSLRDLGIERGLITN